MENKLPGRAGHAQHRIIQRRLNEVEGIEHPQMAVQRLLGTNEAVHVECLGEQQVGVRRLNARKNLEREQQDEREQHHVDVEGEIADLPPTHRAEIARTALQQAACGTPFVEPSGHCRRPRQAQ